MICQEHPRKVALALRDDVFLPNTSTTAWRPKTARQAFGWDTVLNTSAIAMAFAFATTVGIVFLEWPAQHPKVCAARGSQHPAEHDYLVAGGAHPQGPGPRSD